MSFVANRAARLLLGVTLSSAAALKAKHFLIDGHWGDALPLLSSGGSMTLVIAVEAVAAAVLATRWWRFGCWTVIAMLILGNAAFAQALSAAALPSCGCFGHVVVSPTRHAVLSLCVFGLAALLLDRGQGDRSVVGVGEGPGNAGP